MDPGSLAQANASTIRPATQKKNENGWKGYGIAELPFAGGLPGIKGYTFYNKELTVAEGAPTGDSSIQIKRSKYHAATKQYVDDYVSVPQKDLNKKGWKNINKKKCYFI